MKKITSLLTALFCLFLGAGLQAQSAAGTVEVQVFTNPEIGTVPVDRILVESAPHLPWVQRSEATTQVFKGKKFNYDLEANQDKFKSWANQYPLELAAYRKNMSAFFQEHSADVFKGQQQDFYYDMLAQYQIIAQLQGWK